MTKRFENKHVLITGAARGIGFEIAVQFAKEGAVLSILDINEVTLALAATNLEKISPSIYSYVVDISNREAVIDVIASAEEVKPIDILINNAGIAAETPFLNIEEKEWNQILSINLTGMFLVSQTVCKYMAVRKKVWS